MKISAQDILADIKAANIPDVDVDALDTESTFAAQGIDSLDEMSIFLCIEEKYGFKIPDDDIENINSITELADYVIART